jgi:hypothetical protein
VGEHPKGAVENGATMIYDIDRGIWYEGSKRPEIGNHHAAEVINNKLYLFGGLKQGGNSIQVGTLKPDTYKVTIEWKKLSMPISSGSAATAMIDGKVCPQSLCAPMRLGVAQCHAVLCARARRSG